MNSSIRFLLALLILFFLMIRIDGQFSITNALKTTDATGLRIGDNAYLTAANGVDPNGEGWLRLTDATNNQKGYMYVMQQFPTSLGIIADFEYLQWRNAYDSSDGADGFSVFLFDASVTDANFKLGGYGGSLGYATYSSPANTTGLSGGYLGIGFDAYGNYAAAVENRNGGTASVVPNSVVVRGPTRTNYSISNIYLTRTDLGERSGSIAQIRQRNEIDFNTVTATRPSTLSFYRRVQISVTKPGTDYIISVKWRKENQTTFTEILNYTLLSSLYPIPANLKLGFAASTGGSFNFHEIRNILLTTPGNLRVDSRNNPGLVCNEKKNTVTFTVEVSNDTPTALSNISYNTKIVNAANAILSTGQFKITSLSTSGFTNSNLPVSNFTSNEISGVIGLPAKASGIVTITGVYQRGLKPGQIIKGLSQVTSSQITDTDLTNNSASAVIDVRKCGILSNPALPARYK